MEEGIWTFKNVRPQDDSDSEFEIPEVADGMYAGVIGDVKGVEFPDFNNPDEMIPKYVVAWLLEVPGADEPVELAQFVKVPLGLRQHGFVSQKSNLYPFLKAIGLDPDAPRFDVDPQEWVGREAHVIVENKLLTQGKNAGQTRPQITKLLRAGVEAIQKGSQGSQEGQHAEWNALGALMPTMGLVRADVEPLLAGFSETSLILWLSENRDKNVADLCAAAAVNKAKAKAMFAPTT